MQIKHLLRPLIAILPMVAFQIQPVLGEPTRTADLQTQWSSLVMRSPGLVHATISAYAFDLTTGKPLAAIHPDLRQTPASVTKLITSAAALDTLGPAFRYATRVAVLSHEAAGSSPIYLVGGGDPLLEANNTQALESMAKKVAESVHSATRVIGVATLYKGPDVGTGWALNDVAADYGAGTDALMAERSEIIVHVTATKVGQPPHTQLQFNSAAGVPAYFSIVNRAVTVPAGGEQTLTAFRNPGTNTLSIRGTIPLGTSEDEFLSIGNGPAYAATLFQKLLMRDGVRFTSPASTGVLPSGTKTILKHVSEPLAESIKLQNQYSINQMAENLYRMVGVWGGTDGSLAGAGEVMTRFLKRAGVDVNGLQMVDGSGVSPLDDMTSRQVVQVLRYAAQRPWFNVYEHSMMKLNSTEDAGILAGHPFQLPVGSAVWLKTGNLSNQWNYAGYAQLPNGHRIAFAILDDGPTTKSLDAISSPLDQMVEALAKSPTPPHGAVSLPASSDGFQPSVLPPQLAFMKAKLSALGLTDGVVGLSVANAATGKVVWSDHGDKILPSGALPRLSVADAALSRYGDSRFGALTVQVHGTVQAGTLHGWITLNGHGNPTLSEGDFMHLAAKVRSVGIRSIQGFLRYVDEKNPSPWPEAMPWNDMGQAFAPPLSDLSVNGDVVTIELTAGTDGRAAIQVSPADAPIKVVNETSVTNTSHVGVGVTYDAWHDAYVVSGQVSANDEQFLPIAPKNAGRVAAVAFRDALRQEGVSIPRTVLPVTKEDASNTGRMLAQGPGPTVATVATDVLDQSSSQSVGALYALLGTPEAADKTVSDLVGKTASLQDPTALSTENYATADSFAVLLADMNRQHRSKALIDALKAHLWRASAPEVQTAAGYVRAPDGTLYALAVIHSNLLWNGSFEPSMESP